MDDRKFLGSLGDLTGKVAVVTSGSQGIGLQTTLLLSRLGATVYVCTTVTKPNADGFFAAQKELASDPRSGDIHFHPLDLSSIESAKLSAANLREELDDTFKPKRLDIIVGNAGVAFPTLDELGEDGYEKTFAVNCLGHFVFITTLLEFVERTATLHGEARITMTSSEGHKQAKKLDYDALTQLVPNDGKKRRNLVGGCQRYLDSQLAVLYFALELDKRLRARGVNNVFVNACHPGEVPQTILGNDPQSLISLWLAKLIKCTLGVYMRKAFKDAAKTQVSLSASPEVREKDVHGHYWSPMWLYPMWPRRQQYLGSQKEELSTELSKDEEEWNRLWEFCEGAAAKWEASRGEHQG